MERELESHFETWIPMKVGARRTHLGIKYYGDIPGLIKLGFWVYLCFIACHAITVRGTYLG